MLIAAVSALDLIEIDGFINFPISRESMIIRRCAEKSSRTKGISFLFF